MSSNRPNRPKTTEEILAEMEQMSKGVGNAAPGADAAEESGGKKGGLKSLLDFFVKVVPDEDQSSAEAAPSASASRPPANPPPAARPATRVAELVANEPAPQFKTPTTDKGDLSQRPFEQLYREAGIGNSPCSVDELAQLLDNPTIANQPLSVKIVAVNLALSAKGVGLDVPIADAVRRDRALDAYQKMLEQKARSAEERNAAKIEQISKETEEYLKRRQAEIDALRAESAEAQRQSIEFSVRRETEEKRLANLISPFLEGKPNPVSVGNASGEETPQG